MRSLASLAALAALAALAIPSEASADGLIRGRLGVGVHVASTSLADASSDAAEPVAFGGGGLQARYRLAPRWELELSLGGAAAESPELDRELGMVSLGALFHLNPRSSWVWSILGGFGGGSEEVSIKGDGAALDTLRFENGLIYAGGGLQRRFGRLSLAAELRLVGIARDEEAADGPQLAGKSSPVPRQMSGGQLRITGTFYF